MAGVRFKKLIADKLGKDFAETLSKLWPVYNEDMSVSAEMFFAPRKWREFFRKIAVTVEGESNSFISQVYYLMLRCLARQGVKKRICDAAVREITDNDVLLSL